MSLVHLPETFQYQSGITKRTGLQYRHLDMTMGTNWTFWRRPMRVQWSMEIERAEQVSMIASNASCGRYEAVRISQHEAWDTIGRHEQGRREPMNTNWKLALDELGQLCKFRNSSASLYQFEMMNETKNKVFKSMPNPLHLLPREWWDSPSKQFQTILLNMTTFMIKPIPI